MRNLLLFLVSFLCILPLNGQERIQMRQESGVYTIPCTVNGLRLRFIFDTGASAVTISATEALFMLKNDYLSEDDFVTTGEMTLADGSIQENTIINLKEVKIGNKTLENVQAVVMNNISAPLLLGQSAITQLQPWYFDGNVLVFGETPSQTDSAQTLLNTLSAQQCIEEGAKYEERGNLEMAIKFYKQACNLKSYDGYYHYLAFTKRQLGFVKDPLPIDQFAEAVFANQPELCKWLKEEPNLPITYCKYKDHHVLVNVYEALIDKGYHNLCWDASMKAGNGITQEWTKALKFLQIGAEHNDVNCQKGYADAYNPQIEHDRFHFPYIAPDKNKALTWYKKAISNGSKDAVSKYASLVFGDSTSSTQLKSETFNLLRNVAHQGNEDAIETLIDIYFYGMYGYSEDNEKAIYWAKKGAEIGDPSESLYCHANEVLGYMYYNSGDYVNARNHFTKIVENPEPIHILPTRISFTLLGEIYFYGDGTRVDYKKAFDLYSKALEINSTLYTTHLNLRLGYLYKNGNGTEINKRKAYSHFLTAANEGDAEGQSQVAWAYYMGEGVNEDINLARSWYEKAAAQGHDFANYILGRFYGDGVFGYTDLPKAVQYLSKAAESNYDEALYQLGLIYENGGQGVQRNFRLAGEYFKRAADLGHEEAKEKYQAYM